MPLYVNDEAVDETALAQEFAAIKSHFERQGRISCCERDEEFRGYARDNILARVLIAQEARRKFSHLPRADVDEALEALMKEHGGPEMFYMNMGLLPEQEPLVRQNVEVSLGVDRMLKELCAGISDPGDADLRQHYEQNIAQFTSIEEIRSSHIFKSLRQVENRETIFRELCRIREEILNGADFDEMARKHSDKPPEEIDLGFYKRGDLMDEFEFITFSMRVGEVSPVFGGQQSFHLAKVTECKPPVAAPFETVCDQVRTSWLDARRQEKIAECVAELKKRAVIEDRPATEVAGG